MPGVLITQNTVCHYKDNSETSMQADCQNLFDLLEAEAEAILKEPVKQSLDN